MKSKIVNDDFYHIIESLQDLHDVRNRGETIVLKELGTAFGENHITRLTVTHVCPGMRSEMKQYLCSSSLLEDFVLQLETEAKKVYDKAVKDAEEWWPPQPKERTGT